MAPAPLFFSASDGGGYVPAGYAKVNSQKGVQYAVSGRQ